MKEEETTPKELKEIEAMNWSDIEIKEMFIQMPKHVIKTQKLLKESEIKNEISEICLLYTSDAADEDSPV